MSKIIRSQKEIPLTVPPSAHKTYLKNYKNATQDTERLFLFAGDQKIEHLNQDFYGPSIPLECASPEHLFNIANACKIGVFATQLGLIAQYGKKYKNIRYIVKVNSKTNLVPSSQSDPKSDLLWSIEEISAFKKTNKLDIVGVGYTLYLGSEHESTMLQQAAHLIYQAHAKGLLVVLWMYPRGKAVTNERDAALIAGAAGVGAALGADFVKVNPPDAPSSKESATLLKQATLAAGKTKVICSGGSKTTEELYLEQLYDQIHSGGAQGCAVGRNIHQLPLDKAIKLCNAIGSIIYDNQGLSLAKKILKKGSS